MCRYVLFACTCTRFDYRGSGLRRSCPAAATPSRLIFRVPVEALAAAAHEMRPEAALPLRHLHSPGLWGDAAAGAPVRPACAYSCGLPWVCVSVHGYLLSACVCECMRALLATRCRFCQRPSLLHSCNQPVVSVLPRRSGPLRAGIDGLCGDTRREGALRLWRPLLQRIRWR